MAILKLALLGAPGSGKTQLAQELTANTLLPSLLVDDRSPLQTLVASLTDRPEASAARADLLTAARIHLEKYDVTLLMGLDLPQPRQGLLPPHDATQAGERMDGLLRRCLTEAGIAYQVIYGQGDARQQQAIQAITRLSESAFTLDTPKAAKTPGAGTGAPSQALFGTGKKESAWVWMCDKCSDAQCEHRTLLAQQAGKLLQR